VEKSRRDFLKTSGVVVAGAAVASTIPSKVLGANDKVRMAMIGVNGRGNGMSQEFAKNPNVEVTYICDVDTRATEKTIAAVKKVTGKKPKGVVDFRKALESKDVDAVYIAAPDHWHAPASIMSLKAGKHVYVEKPLGHNPREGELLVAAQQKYGKVVQMGNQQRSSVHTMQALKKVQDGIIGRVYMGKAFYANGRGPIGRGKPAAVPEWLDWDLWQGPAPRVEYRDNIVHYNWHWFWRWGTGEVLNNGTHEVDVCRWFLDVDYPTKVTSTGGRFHYDDDWEFYDTQYVGWEFEERKAILWEGRSCNSRHIEGRTRGSDIYGEEGTLIIDRSGYVFVDKKNKVIEKVTSGDVNASLDITGIGGSLNGAHIGNFINGIIKSEKLNSPAHDGAKSVLLCHLGNIAQEKGRSLEIDPRNGRIVNDADAMKMWSRDYEPGWDLTI
jgi:predicted dehydrogenase